MASILRNTKILLSFVAALAFFAPVIAYLDVAPKFVSLYSQWDCADPLSLSGIPHRYRRVLFGVYEDSALSQKVLAGCIDIRPRVSSALLLFGQPSLPATIRICDSSGSEGCTIARSRSRPILGIKRQHNINYISVSTSDDDSLDRSISILAKDGAVRAWKSGKYSGSVIVSEPISSDSLVARLDSLGVLAQSNPALVENGYVLLNARNQIFAYALDSSVNWFSPRDYLIDIDKVVCFGANCKTSDVGSVKVEVLIFRKLKKSGWHLFDSLSVVFADIEHSRSSPSKRASVRALTSLPVVINDFDEVDSLAAPVIISRVLIPYPQGDSICFDMATHTIELLPSNESSIEGFSTKSDSSMVHLCTTSGRKIAFLANKKFKVIMSLKRAVELSTDKK